MTNYKTMFKQYKKVYSFEECLYQNKITLRQAIVTDINSFLQIEEDVYDGVMVISPLVVSSCPERIFRKVDFPAPLAPIRP